MDACGKVREPQIETIHIIQHIFLPASAPFICRRRFHDLHAAAVHGYADAASGGIQRGETMDFQQEFSLTQADRIAEEAPPALPHPFQKGSIPPDFPDSGPPF